MNLENTAVSFPGDETDTSLHFLILWGVIDTLLILATLAGNILTICAVKLSRKLSAVLSNQFIFSLALSDIMVGISFPYHYAFFLVDFLSTTRYLCLLRFVFIIFACSSSICNLLGIAMDRYIAIMYPLHYTRFMTKKVAVAIIVSGWVAALGVSCLPIFWNTWEEKEKCPSLTKVLSIQYIDFIIIPMFASIWVTMSVVYFRIWREATGHSKRLKRTSFHCGKNYNDSKSVQVVLLILGCFSICWLPFYVVIIIIKLDSSIVYETTLRLAIANSCMNPIIYAWKNSNFRKIFWCLLRCKKPNALNYHTSFITNYTPPAKKSAQNKAIDNGIYVIKQSDIDVEMQYYNVGKSNGKCGSETEGSVGTVSTSASSLPRT